MRRLLSLLLLILSVPVFGADLADRSRIPDRSMRDGRPVYVASLAPLLTTYLPQIIPLPGGGGGGGMSIGGAVTSGTAGEILYIGAGGTLQQSPLQLTSDTAPQAMYLSGEHAWPDATVNTSGGDLTIGPGLGRRLYTVVDYTALALDTATVTVNGTATVRTEGTHWTAATSNAATATSLASAIDGIAGVAAVASGAEVHVTADNGTYALTIASGDGVNLTVASGTNGVLAFNTGGTATRVLFVGPTGLLADDADMVFVTDTLTATKIGATSITGNLKINDNVALNIGTTDGAGNAYVYNNPTLTPDGPGFYAGSTSSSFRFAERGDAGFDFNNGRCLTTTCTNPSLIVHSADQVTTEYLQLSTDATGLAAVQSNLADIRIGGRKTAITESAAQAIVRVGLPTSTNTYGMTVFYSISDITGADYVTRTGSVKVQGGNSAGTAVCTINTAQDAETEDGSQVATSNAATLTYTWTNVVSTTNCDLSLNAVSSEGINTVAITWSAVVNGNSNAITVTAQ